MAILHDVKSGIPTRYRAFSCAFLEAWTLFQFRGWLVRKTTLEPGGRQHANVGAFAKLPDATRVFVRNFAPGVLDIIRFRGKEVVLALREAGIRMAEVGLAVPCGELKSPLEGVPLANGSSIQFDRELLVDLALSRHAHWMAMREQSWLSPFTEMHQDRNHKAHKRFHRERPEPAWDADLVSVYGDCYALAQFTEESFHTLLEASTDSPLQLKVYGEALSTEFRSSWAQHFVSYAEGWRWHVRGTKPPTEARGVEELLFAQDRAEALLDCVRLYGMAAIAHLKEVGSQLLCIGASATAVKEFDPTAGVSLRDGSVAAIEEGLLEDLADEHRLIFEQLLAGYAEFPFRRVRALSERGSAPSLDRDKARVYGLAVALAALTESQWHELCSAT